MTSLPKFLLIGVFFLWSRALYGQATENIVQGKVVNPDHVPVFLATISLYSIDSKLIASSMTDSTGCFRIAHRLTGNYYLLIKHLGYKDLRSSSFNPTHDNVGTLHLLREENTLEAAEVEGKKKLFSVNGGTLVYHVENSIGSQDISAFDALKRSPGVEIENDTDITLNG